MSNIDREQQLALQYLRDGSGWNRADLLEGQSIAVNNAYAFNIPMEIFDLSARNFSGYRRDDMRSRNVFSMLMFFMHLVEHACQQLRTNTTAFHKRRAQQNANAAAAVSSEDAALASQLRVLDRAIERDRGGATTARQSTQRVFDPTASPTWGSMEVVAQTPTNTLLCSPTSDGHRETDPQSPLAMSLNDDDLETLLVNIDSSPVGGTQSDPETEERAVVSDNASRARVGAMLSKSTSGGRAFDIQPGTELAPAIYVLLEQVPLDGHRVSGEGRFHEMLDMLQEDTPRSYTLHILTCGIDLTKTMADVLATNTLRNHELPVFTTSYADDQRRNMFLRGAIVDLDEVGGGEAADGGRKTRPSQRIAGRGGRDGGASRGRGRGRGRGGHGRSDQGRGGTMVAAVQQYLQNVSENEGTQGDRESDDSTEDAASTNATEERIPSWVENVGKRRRTFESAASSIKAPREPWEYYLDVSLDNIAALYADMFGGIRTALEFQSRHPGRMMDLSLDNPCHPNNMFSVTAALLGRGSNVSYAQSIELYARHHEQWPEHMRRTRTRGGGVGYGSGSDQQRAVITQNNSRQTLDAIDLAPRCPYVPRYPEVYAADGKAAIYMWTPPPGTTGRFLHMNTTELACSVFCNKALPHRQHYSPLLTRIWPGLFGPRAIVQVRETSDDVTASATPSPSIVGDADTLDVNNELYNILPQSLRARLNSQNLAEFGPQVKCPVVDGQNMSIEQVRRLIELMRSLGGPSEISFEQARIHERVTELQVELRKVSSQVIREVDERNRVQQQQQQQRRRQLSLQTTNHSQQDRSVMDDSSRNSLLASAENLEVTNLQNSDLYNTDSTNGTRYTSYGSIVLQSDNDTRSSSMFSFARYAFGDQDESSEHTNGYRLEHRNNTSPGAISPELHTTDDIDDNTTHQRLSATILEPSSRSMPASSTDFRRTQAFASVRNFGVDHEDARRKARSSAVIARIGTAAPSSNALRAERMRQSNTSLSGAHTARISSHETRELLERMELRLRDLDLLCRASVREQLIEAQELYDNQTHSQQRWLQSVRALVDAHGEHGSALPFASTVTSDGLLGSDTSCSTSHQQSMVSLQHGNALRSLESMMGKTSPIVHTITPTLLLRGFYASKENETTGQNLVDVGEAQYILRQQLNARIVNRKSTMNTVDMRAWTILHERSAMREFQERVYDPSANIPVALSVVFECARKKHLHSRIGRMMHARMDSRMGSMQNHMARMLEWYNALFCVAKCQLTLMGWISSQCATHHSNELHPNILVMGDAAASKTWPLSHLHKFRCNLGPREVRKTTVESTRETERSSSHDGRHTMDYRVTIDNEASKFTLVGEDRTGDPVFKQLLDHCQVFVQTLERNISTNRFEFMERFASYIGVRIMCANWPVAELPLPIMTRVILVLCTQPRGALGNIAQAMARRQEQVAADEAKADSVVNYHNFLHYVQAMTDSMITCGSMKDVNMWLSSFVITYINSELKRRSRPTLQPRFIMHIESWIRAVVKENVLAREFSYLGGIFQAHDVTPERILLLQPYMYANMSTIVFVLGMLSRHSSIEGEDDVRKAVCEIIKRQRNALRVGVESIRAFSDMFRIVGYQRGGGGDATTMSGSADRENGSVGVSGSTPVQPTPSGQLGSVGANSVNSSSNRPGPTDSAFVSQLNMDQMMDSEFMLLDEDSMSMAGQMNESSIPSVQPNGSSDVGDASRGFDSNFPGLRDQFGYQTPPAAISDRGILPTNNAATDVRGGGNMRANTEPFRYNPPPRTGGEYVSQNKPIRDPRFVTFRLRGINDSGSSAGYKSSPLQQASSVAAAMLLPTLKELNSSLTRDMVCALLMMLSEQYIKSPRYILDGNEVRVCSATQPENVRVVEFEPGLLHVSYHWLQLMDVNTTRVVRDILIQLNSHRHQPYELCLWQHDEMFPNTFETLEIGNRDCESERHKELIFENPAHYSMEELQVLYTAEEMVHHEGKRVPLMRINCSLNELAAEKRASELRWCNEYITERTLAKVLYSRAEETFGADRTSEYHNVQFEPAHFSALDDTQCLQMPDCYYHVPNPQWSRDVPHDVIVPKTVAHWDILLSHVKDVSERRRIYCQLSYFTNEEVIKHRMECWEKYTKRTYIKYPTALHQRFIENITQYAESPADANVIRNLLQEELRHQSGIKLNREEEALQVQRRTLGHTSIANLRSTGSGHSSPVGEAV